MARAASVSAVVRGLAVASLVVLAGCAGFDPRPLPTPPPAQIDESIVKDGVKVAASILTDEQARQHYGVDLASRGLQATWLRIHNASSDGLWFLVAAFDPDYYAPNEAAFLFHPDVAGEHEARLSQHFREQAIPLRVEPGETVSGYVLAPRHEGGRYVNVELIGKNRRLQFGSALAVAGTRLDFDDLESTSLYADDDRRELDAGALRTALRELPCCTSNAGGDGHGDPLNVVLVGTQEELLTALARSGWSFTHELDLQGVGRLVGAAIAGTPYAIAPISSLYLFGREQDVALQRARTAIAQRNHMRLWLTPYDFEGRPVWAGQVSRDVGVKLTTKSPSLTTHIIDPLVDETREYLFQSLLVHHMVERFGFVAGVGAAPPGAPRFNLTGDAYVTDGLRLVVVLAPKLLPPQQARNFHWQQDTDPLKGRFNGVPSTDTQDREGVPGTAGFSAGPIRHEEPRQ